MAIRERRLEIVCSFSAFPSAFRSALRSLRASESRSFAETTAFVMSCEPWESRLTFAISPKRLSAASSRADGIRRSKSALPPDGPPLMLELPTTPPRSCVARMIRSEASCSFFAPVVSSSIAVRSTLRCPGGTASACFEDERVRPARGAPGGTASVLFSVVSERSAEEPPAGAAAAGAAALALVLELELEETVELKSETPSPPNVPVPTTTPPITSAEVAANAGRSFPRAGRRNQPGRRDARGNPAAALASSDSRARSPATGGSSRTAATSAAHSGSAELPASAASRASSSAASWGSRVSFSWRVMRRPSGAW